MVIDLPASVGEDDLDDDPKHRGARPLSETIFNDLFNIVVLLMSGTLIVQINLQVVAADGD